MSPPDVTPLMQAPGVCSAAGGSEELVLKVWLPGDALKEVTLEVLQDLVSVDTPRHRLRLHLPHKVCWCTLQHGLGTLRRARQCIWSMIMQI